MELARRIVDDVRAVFPPTHVLEAGSQFTFVQFIFEWSFLLMVGGVFVFFGASRERSTERLTQIADWPENRLQSYTNINGHWLDTSLEHIATVLQATGS